MEITNILSFYGSNGNEFYTHELNKANILFKNNEWFIPVNLIGETWYPTNLIARIKDIINKDEQTYICLLKIKER